jgi:phosphoribosylformylglycinamidine (FGAM) synthase-like enzyme
VIRRIWQAAPRLSLVHDVGQGGFAAAVAEMAAWSGVAARVADAGEDVRFVLACAPDAVPDFADQVGSV